MALALSGGTVEAAIFIQIASYRDPQLGDTLRDLVAKASNPAALGIGICLQIEPSDAGRCGPDSLPQGPELRGAQLRLDCVPAASSGGVCWARARTQRLWQGEAFTLQIDSHMRAVPGWDQELLQMWRRCADPSAVLSCYPNAFQLPDHCDTSQLPLLGALRFDEHGILRLQGINSFANPDGLPPQPLPGAFVAAGMVFAPAGLIESTPYDPQLYFYGEEISLGLRLWTRGYNLYNPDRLVIFHLYKAAGLHHITHWADHPDWPIRHRLALERLQALLHGGGLPSPFGLGTARSLASWQAWSGVNLESQTITEAARAGRFSPPPAAGGAPLGPS